MNGNDSFKSVFLLALLMRTTTDPLGSRRESK